MRDQDLVSIVAALQDEVRAMRLEQAARSAVPAGLVVPWQTKWLPSGGWDWADGTAVTRAAYPEMFANLVPLLGTVTVTLASPGVFTLAGHGLAVGDAVYLTTTGALPTGLSANTLYYVMTVPTSSTFTLGTSRSSTAVTSAVNTSGSQSGVHSIRACPWGLGNGTTTFNKPDYRGVAPTGLDSFGSGTDRGKFASYLNAVGLVVGAETHLLTGAESGTSAHGHADNFTVGKGTLSVSSTGGTHTHPIGQSGTNNIYEGQGYPDGGSFTGSASKQEPGSGTSKTSGNNSSMTFTYTVGGAPSISGSVSNSSAADASSAHNNMQPSVFVPWIVKT